MVNKPKFAPIDVINVAGILIAVYLAAVLAQTIYQNYTLNRQIETLRGQIDLLKAQQDQLRYSITYYKTDSFREREARAKLGLQLPGEGVLILPNPRVSDEKSASSTQTGPRNSNWGQWMDFLGGKSS